MRDLLLALIVFSSLPLALVRPHIGILVFNWLSLMNPHRLTWGFAYNMRVAVITGVVTLFAWLFSREPKYPPNVAPVWILGLFTAWLTLCTVLALRPDLAWVKWEQVIKILVMTFVAMCLLKSRERIHLMVWVAALSLGFYGIRGGIFTILTGGQWRVYGPEGSFIEDNNQLALALVMILPLLWYLQATTATRWIRWGLWGAAGLTIVAIAGTYSRGGVLALAVVAAVLLWRSRNRLATFALLFAVIGGLFLFKPEQWFNRMQSITEYQTDESTRGRFDAWTFAYRVAQQRPLTGGGFSVFYHQEYFRSLVPGGMSPRNAHSIYFEVLGESGFVGLGIFLMLGLSCLMTCGWVRRRTRDRPDLAWAHILASMLQVSLIGYATAGAFLNLGFFDLYYTLVAVIVVLRHVVGEELAGARQAAGAAMPAPGAPVLQPGAAQ